MRHTPRIVFLGTILALAPSLAAQSLRVESLSLAAQPFRLTDEICILLVCEAEQGNQDFNGDGDTFDDVLHLLHVPSRTLTNIGLDVSGQFALDAAEQWLYFLVSESGQGGIDQNGDGDSSDLVIFAYDMTTGELRSAAGVSGNINRPTLATSGSRVFFESLEQGGIPTDWNGDGDMTDTVILAYDAAADTVLSIGQAGFFLAAAQNHGLLFIDESEQANTDLNGDGDTSDNILHSLDLTTLTLTNLGFSLGAIQAFESFVYCGAPEFGIVDDVNGDGDMDDTILCILDGITGSFTVTGLAIELLPVDFGVIPGDDAFIALSNESAAEQDWNGDGDISCLDDVAFLYNYKGNTLKNLGLAVEGFAGASVGSDWVLLAVGEVAQGNVDLNGDGDRDDRVLYRYGLIDGQAENLGLSIKCIDRDGAFADLHSVILAEREEGIDWNGDGDMNDDQVGFVIEASTNTMHVFGAGNLPTFPIAEGSGPGFLAGIIDEEEEGLTDLNGDGDLCDNVLQILFPCQGVQLSTGLAVQLDRALSFGDTVLTVVVESLQSQDTNGDGDMDDQVVHLITVDASSGVSVSTADGLTGSAGFAPSLTVGTCPVAGLTTSLSLNQGLGGAPAVIIMGTQAVSFDLFSQTLHVSPFEVFWIGALGGDVGVGGAGGVRLSADLSDISLAGSTIILQGAVLDTVAPSGVLLTEALFVTIGDV